MTFPTMHRRGYPPDTVLESCLFRDKVVWRPADEGLRECVGDLLKDIRSTVLMNGGPQ